MASDDSWSGWIAFAGIVLLIVGSIDMIQGLFLIIDDDYVVASGEGLDFIDTSAWGWIALLWGALLFFAGLALFKAAGWARWLAIFACGVGAIVQMAQLGNYPNAYPLWHLTILTLEIVVLYALVAKWEGYKKAVASYAPPPAE
jgi:hypothetical protein